ncbi:hypothetical protein CGC20_37365 [Leishmania donovani]|uniref:Uncharacterized protein n=1 Tax=Leishmania donovani TaxID=5661 RepID=A0A504Y7F7_LEIDO|nr:hypothetical protein CGC20_37365 [Leishmania donovani]
MLLLTDKHIKAAGPIVRSSREIAVQRVSPCESHAAVKRQSKTLFKDSAVSRFFGGVMSRPLNATPHIAEKATTVGIVYEPAVYALILTIWTRFECSAEAHVRIRFVPRAWARAAVHESADSRFEARDVGGAHRGDGCTPPTPAPSPSAA